MNFTPAELTYLGEQRLGRLATVDRDGAPQNDPRAEALAEQEPSRSYVSPEVIRVHPEQVFTWGIEPGADGMQKRRIRPTPAP